MSSSFNSRRNKETKPNDVSTRNLTWEVKRVLIVVKTYPSISTKYEETVCTAGITSDGDWIRLYPLRFRKLPYYKWFKKYQWVEVKVKRHTRDIRKDSYQPEPSYLKLGKHLDTKKDKKWAERKLIVEPTVSKSLEYLSERYDNKKLSLGIFKPKEIIKFEVESDKGDWSSMQKHKLSQLKLFGSQPKKLDKIPFKFSYNFVCDDARCNGHKLSIHDWEIFQLYRRLRDDNGYAMDVILEKIKNKFMDDYWSKNRDSHLIVGTVYPKKTFIVLGVFWPPK